MVGSRLAHLGTPRRSMTTDGPKDPAGADLGCDHPTVDSLFDPGEHVHGPNVTALANQVHNRPMSLSDLHVPHWQGD